MKDELKTLQQIFAVLKSKYLTPYGWKCSPAMCDVVLNVFAAIKRIENGSD